MTTGTFTYLPLRMKTLKEHIKKNKEKLEVIQTRQEQCC